MTLKISRRGIVPPFIVMDVMRAANQREAQGQAVYHLEVGQPGTGAPQGVIEAVKKIASIDPMGYTEAFGIPPLRDRISEYYQSEYKVEIPAARIVVTTGSSGGFVLSFLAAFDPGDRVALASPGYPAYRNILQAVGVEVIDLPVGPETNFQPTPDILQQEAENSGKKLDGLIIASPSNPTGTMIDAAGLKEIVAYCQQHTIRLISDEIYHGITYADRAVSAANFTDDAIILNSFSKYFSMTGWRLGWMVLPEDLLRPVECLAQNLFISAPTISQHAGVAAFDCSEELEANVLRYRDNRELLLRELPRAGFDKLASADGAFYIYADISHLSDDSSAFCKRMLAETGVAATPGIDFDPGRGNRYVRFSFSRDTSMIEQAAEQLCSWKK